METAPHHVVWGGRAYEITEGGELSYISRAEETRQEWEASHPLGSRTADVIFGEQVRLLEDYARRIGGQALIMSAERNRQRNLYFDRLYESAAMKGIYETLDALCKEDLTAIQKEWDEYFSDYTPLSERQPSGLWRDMRELYESEQEHFTFAQFYGSEIAHTALFIAHATEEFPAANALKAAQDRIAALRTFAKATRGISNDDFDSITKTVLRSYLRPDETLEQAADRMSLSWLITAEKVIVQKL